MVLTEHNARATMERIQEENPDLSWHGYRHRVGRDEHEVARADMLTEGSLAGFVAAARFLDAAVEWRSERTAPRSSYWWKHVADAWAHDTYISNGMFIAAALALDVPVRRHMHSPNAAIGSRCGAAQLAPTFNGGRR